MSFFAIFAPSRDHCFSSQVLTSACRLAFAALFAFACLRSAAPPPRYPSPVELAISPDGARLFAVCDGTDEVVAIETNTGKILRRVPVGRVPKSISFSPDGARLYVANSWSDTVTEIDARSLTVARTLPAGYEPTSAITDRSGAFLYVANRISNDVSVIDLATGRETKRLPAGRGASYLSRSPDGARIYCTHIYPNPGNFRSPPESEVTVIGTARQEVANRLPLHNSAGVFHSAISPNGAFGLAAELRPKNLVPLAHVERGGAFGNALALFGTDIGEAVHVPIDELDRYYTPPYSVAIAPDRSAVYISTTGSNSVTVLDLGKLLGYVKSLAPAQRRLLATDLSASAKYVRARIPVGDGPKGIVLSPDGRRLYVANRTGDTISVIDTARARVTATWALGAPATLSPQRRGERLFYSARFAFQGHMGCANCHLDATFDGLSWDLEPDGFGKDIVDNRLLEDIADTAPFKWNGGNPDIATECGRRTETFFWRSESYNETELADLVSFVESIPSRPNRFRPKDGKLSPAQQRGKAIFEREQTRNGRPIPGGNRCSMCHSGPQFTSQRIADVGTAKPTDISTFFDTPQLTNVALTAPYLHDGSAGTLLEIFTVFNPNDTHGFTSDLSRQELNDLVEYLKTL